MGLSIIIPFLNERYEIFDTIESIQNTIDVRDYEIIAIDDKSDKSSDLSIFNNVKQIVNKNRMGVDGSRQLGVEESKYDNCAIFDGHMRFNQDQWASKMIESIKNEPNVIWCTTCLGLGYGTMDLNKHKGEYNGATMLFYDKNASSDRPSRECIEPKWLPKAEADIEYDIPCVLGANYFFSKKWYNHIGGLKGLKMWGTSEPFLSLKSWMAGGKCKIRRDIGIGHRFRDNAPYTTLISHLVYNKIFLCKTILEEDLSNKLIGFLPKDINYKSAIKEIDNDIDFIKKQREYYKTIFKYDINYYCNKFKIDLP